MAGKRCDYNMYFQQYDSYSYGLKGNKVCLSAKKKNELMTT